MIKIKTKKSEFYDLIKIIAQFNIDVDFNFLKDGLAIRAVDLSNICLVSMKLKKTFFDSYEIEKDVTYTLDVKSLLGIVRKISKKEFTIEMKSEGLVFKNASDEFLLNCYAGNKDMRAMPNVTHSEKWKVDVSDLFSNLDDIKEFCTVVKFKSADNLMLEINSNLVKGKIALKANKGESKGVFGYYDATYFYKIMDIKSLFKELEFLFENEKPCILRGSSEVIDFEWLLAGRMEDKNE